ncbi:MAG: hypothetical protein JWP01_3309 [Myxococcales bacterium]|nr:hypothetical protein [Myxococcales bacterium]
MFDGGTAEDEVPATCGVDVRRRLRLILAALSTLDLSAPSAELEKQLRELQDQGQQLDAQLRGTVATLEPLEQQFRRWSAILARASASRTDPRERFAIHHDAGDWDSALDAYQQAFAAIPAAQVPMPAVHRHLDGLARLGRREAYRQVLADQRERLALRDLDVDALDEFGRHVLPAIAWVFSSDLGTGSGFLVAPDLVVTNRHVVTEEGPVQVGAIASTSAARSARWHAGTRSRSTRSTSSCRGPGRSDLASGPVTQGPANFAHADGIESANGQN